MASAETRTRACLLAERLNRMTEDEVRVWASKLPAVQGMLRSRDVYYLGDDLVLKIAPDPAQPCPFGHEQHQCECYDEDCTLLHPEDIEDCLCQNRKTSSSYSEGQNEAEAVLWAGLSDEMRPYFAEIYASSGSGLWVIQERVVPLQGYEQMPLVLYDVADEAGVGDLKKTNCGHRFLEDKNEWVPVIFDYGISQVWQRLTGERDLTLVDSDDWHRVQLPDA